MNGTREVGFVMCRLEGTNENEDRASVEILIDTENGTSSSFSEMKTMV